MSQNPTRVNARHIMNNSDAVSISDSAINDFVESSDFSGTKIPTWDFGGWPERDDDIEDAIQFFGVFNAVNFCFNDVSTGQKFETIIDGEKFDGSDAVVRCFDKAWRNDELNLLDADVLSDLSRSDLNKIVSPAPNSIQLPLLQERAEMLNEVGEILNKRYEGEFNTLVKESDGLYNHGDGFIDRLVSEFPSAYGRDVWSYNDTSIRFDKRAQLFAAMIHGYSQDEEREIFPEVSQLTLFADYGVPNTLRWLDILNYCDELAGKIDNCEKLRAGSREEVEIRAATVHAGEKIINTVNRKKDCKINACHLDFILWSQRREPDTPEHLTKTTAY